MKKFDGKTTLSSERNKKDLEAMMKLPVEKRKQVLLELLKKGEKNEKLI